MSGQTVSIRVAPGGGLVARVGEGVLVVTEAAATEQTQPLLDALREACEGKTGVGRQLARRVLAYMIEVDPSTVPGFASLAPDEDGWAVTLHGGVDMRIVSSAGEEVVSGRQAATWVDRIVPHGFDRLLIGPEGSAVEVPSGPFELHGGIVPGAGIVVEVGGGAAAPAQPSPPAAEPAAQPQQQPPPAQPQAPPAPPPPAQPAAPPAQPQQPAPPPPAPPPPAPPPAQPAAPVASAPPPPAPPAPSEEPPTAHDPVTSLPPPEQAEVQQTPPAPMPEPEEDMPFEAVSLLAPEDVPEREPLAILGEAGVVEEDETPDAPEVDGILCERGHFNHPLALYCSSCGVSTVHRTRNTVKGPRPPLGVLVADDGSAYSLDHDYLVGREPELEDTVSSGELRPLRLEDAERSVSRVHAEVRLDSWDVQVIDRGSANGTFVAPRGESEWRRLQADKAEVVAPGTRLAFGKRVMTFDTHHQA